MTDLLVSFLLILVINGEPTETVEYYTLGACFEAGDQAKAKDPEVESFMCVIKRPAPRIW